MSESKKRQLNKSHPDCAEYTKRFDELWDTYMKLRDQEDKKYPDWQGLDSPAHEVLRPAYRKLSEGIKALQREYAYLFTEED